MGFFESIDRTGIGRTGYVISAAVPALLCASPLAAQDARVAANPVVLQPEASGAPVAPKLLLAPTPATDTLAPASTAHERVLDLDVVYTDSEIYNPATGLYDKVHLRSYDGPQVDPKHYVSPTIEIVPGDTIRVNLNNKLPADPSCAGGMMHSDAPHCFNGTNLHTHGLWVNPAGNGDNVLLSINPGVSFQYEYNVPGDHPSGTFWYHTHRHGSTALQVSSGMAGALIIRGDRLPSPSAHGDIDTLIKGMPEQIMVMQQIQYACRGPSPGGGALGPIKLNKDGTYRCDPGDVGAIEGYDLFAPGQWAKSGRYTTINGQVLPTYNAVQGRIERWRMIHAGVRDTISLVIVKMTGNASLTAKLSEAASEKFARQNCSGPAVPYNLIAADGLTMAAAQQTRLATFQPAYRFDALVVFPDAGQYCLIDASSPGAGSVNGDTPGPRLLGRVTVAPGTAVPDIGAYVTDALVAAAEQRMPPSIGPAIVADLKAGMKLTQFTPHPDIDKAEVTGKQELTFFIDTSTPATRFEVGNSLQTADVKPYDAARIDRQLTLGGVDEWTLQSHFVSHPFHIHVNPFQIVSIIDPNGKDVSAIGSVDDAGGTVDPEYAGLKGVWKDTLWIKSLAPGDPRGIYTITVRTRYQRYIGEFVLHCHILDHEDQGMMQNVAVVLGQGEVSAAQSAAGAEPMAGMHEMP
jgi:L-ascorbate oxidase